MSKLNTVLNAVLESILWLGTICVSAHALSLIFGWKEFNQIEDELMANINFVTGCLIGLIVLLTGFKHLKTKPQLPKE